MIGPGSLPFVVYAVTDPALCGSDLLGAAAEAIVSRQGVREALVGRPIVGFWSRADGLLPVVSTPIVIGPGQPEILGTVSVSHEGGEWTMAIYFTSEDAAREGEKKEPPPQMQATMKELDALTVGEPAFFDLKDPWLHAPR